MNHSVTIFNTNPFLHGTTIPVLLIVYSIGDMTNATKKTKYVPVCLNDKVAHGHYDGYCKQSMSFGIFIYSTIF